MCFQLSAGNWKKLKEQSNFLAFAEHPDCTNGGKLMDAFHAIFHICRECHDLAMRYINVSYSGKLLMWSDLDNVISKLDYV